ncbi:MAG TPA: response regulator [Bryobacteraceae bacterium]|nr:response regulator [Bryobacteraceae bacterium]
MSAPSSSGPCFTPVRTDTGVTVLVVDDYQSGLYIKARVLAEAGFHVLKASSGAEALRMFDEHRPAVVVLDVRLPDIDGMAVCRAIKHHPSAAQTMVLQVSAYYTSNEHQVLGLDSGADAYLPGDIAPALLVAAVRALLRTRRAEEALRDREERLQLLDALDQSEQKLRALAAGLFTAQEEERRRIARELHDDFSQRMALVEITLSKLLQQAPEFHSQLAGVIAQISALSQDLRDVSHVLHPSGLEHLGLQRGLRSLCEEFERAHNLAVRFRDSTGGGRVAEPTATVFYRIAQEALRNVVKHAGDARATINLSASDGELSLKIEDDGCGFDMSVAQHRTGLGFISMQERARLVEGRVEVRSEPGQGTVIVVTAPWPQAP